MKIRRILPHVAIWAILAAGAFLASILLDQGTLVSGPLMPGQERPIYHGGGE